MEVEEIESVLEKIWDLHDKLSDTIHSISRSYFLKARKPTQARLPNADNKGGDMDESAVEESKSLNCIRTALENLEEQLQFFHTVQNQQRAERDAAIARLEQSRIVFAMRLSGHQGKKYKVIEEAQAFVGNVHEASRFISPEVLFGPQFGDSTEKFISDERKNCNNVLNLLWSKLNLIKKTLKLEQVGGVLGNAALVAISMMVLIHVPKTGQKDDYILNLTKVSRPDNASSPDYSTQLDVLSARG